MLCILLEANLHRKRLQSRITEGDERSEHVLDGRCFLLLRDNENARFGGSRKIAGWVRKSSLITDFMFELTRKEWKELITNCDKLPDTVKFSPTVPCLR